MQHPIIMVVDDDPSFIQFMHELLPANGYEVVSALDRDSGYTIIRQLKPDLIMLDLRMQRADCGLLLLNMLRLDSELAATPVLICTGDIPFLRQHGADLEAQGCGLLGKPFMLDELFAALKQLLSAGGGRALERGA